MSLDPQLLDRLEGVGDPELDAVIATATPAELRVFDAAHAALPPWADLAALARGQQVFGRHSFMISTSLFCAALPYLFCFPPGARILHRTRQLQRDMDLRLVETGEFIYCVLSPGSFSVAGASALTRSRRRATSRWLCSCTRNPRAR